MNTPQINDLIQKQIASTALGPKKFEDYIWKCNAEGGEPMSDLIDRQAAIKAIEDLPNCYNGFSDTYDKSCIIGVLEELPSAQPLSAWGGNPLHIDLLSAQPERKKGKWIPFSQKSQLFSCSLCGQWADRHWNFCPSCGAEMRGEENG